MKYIPPLNALQGDETNENRSYWNADPSSADLAAREGSYPSAPVMENPQREIINTIIAAGLVPDGDDLTQLSQAIQAMIDASGAGGASGQLIGQPFPLWTHLTGVQAPDNSGDEKFICLTAGLTGTGAYNEGLLTNESISGSFPNNTATAQIVGGDLDGQTVALINTEHSFLRPSLSSGAYEQDTFKNHTHDVNLPRGDTNFNSGGGNTLWGSNTNRTFTSTSVGGTETRPKNRGATYYMRII